MPPATPIRRLDREPARRPCPRPQLRRLPTRGAAGARGLRIDARRLSAGCLLASGGPAERALNLYIDVINTWGDCLATVSCKTRTVEPKLQRKWALAAHQVTIAWQGLRRV